MVLNPINTSMMLIGVYCISLVQFSQTGYPLCIPGERNCWVGPCIQQHGFSWYNRWVNGVLLPKYLKWRCFVIYWNSKYSFSLIKTAKVNTGTTHIYITREVCLYTLFNSCIRHNKQPETVLFLFDIGRDDKGDNLAILTGMTLISFRSYWYYWND